MNNVLQNREHYDLIRTHPLFKGTTEEEFLSLMNDCEINFYRKGERMLKAKTPRGGLHLILSGVAEVTISGGNDRKENLEVLQRGEMIGFSSLAYFLGELEGEDRSMTVDVEAMEDLHCLKIPYSVLEKRWKDEDVRLYILKKVAVRLHDIYVSLAEQIKLAAEWGESEPYVRRVQDLMVQDVKTVTENATIQQAAKKMVEHSIGSVVVVDDERNLLGILTDKDIVHRVVATNNNALKFVKDIMTPNPHTIYRNAYYYEAISKIYMKGVKHLPVVEENKVVGIVTLSGLLAKRNHGQIDILKKIEESTFESLPLVKDAIYSVLSSLLHDDISTTQLLEIITGLYDRLVRHCVYLAVESLEKKGKGKPPVPFAWYQMGSGARGEQFMLTDQDHFLVYANPNSANKKEVEAYFAELGEEIVRHLHQAGYELCKGKMMSNNPDWRGSLSDWEEQLKSWAIQTTDEQILLCHNFLSFRFLYGNEALNDQFVDMVRHILNVSQTLLYYMAQQEREQLVPQIEQSFLGLFKARQKKICIKRHALFPLHHCLQIIGALNGYIEGTSLQLLNELVRANVLTKSLSDDLMHAYEVALRTRIKMSWKKHLKGEQSTPEIELGALPTWEKDEIIRMLKVVRALQFHLLSKL